MLELLVRRHGGVWRNPLQVGLQKQTAMVLCLLSRGSHGDRTKLNHEETSEDRKSPFYSKKSEILLSHRQSRRLKKFKRGYGNR